MEEPHSWGLTLRRGALTFSCQCVGSGVLAQHGFPPLLHLQGAYSMEFGKEGDLSLPEKGTQPVSSNKMLLASLQ